MHAAGCRLPQSFAPYEQGEGARGQGAPPSPRAVRQGYTSTQQFDHVYVLDVTMLSEYKPTCGALQAQQLATLSQKCMVADKCSMSGGHQWNTLSQQAPCSEVQASMLTSSTAVVRCYIQQRQNRLICATPSSRQGHKSTCLQCVLLGQCMLLASDLTCRLCALCTHLLCCQPPCSGITHAWVTGRHCSHPAMAV